MTTIHLRLGVICLVVVSVWSGIPRPQHHVNSPIVILPPEAPPRLVARAEPGVVADTELSVSDLRRRGTVRFLMHHGAASYFLYRGAQMGFEYELAREFAKQFGVELEVVTPPPGVALTTWLKEGKGDIVAGLATTDASGLAPLLASVPYLQTTAEILTPKEEAALHDPMALSGKHVIVQPDSPYASQLLSSPAVLPIPPVLQDTISDTPFSEASFALLQKRVAGALLLSPLARLVHAVYPGRLHTALHLTTPIRLVWAVRPGQNELLQVVNHYLEQVSRSGLRRILFAKYFVEAKHLRTPVRLRESTLLTKRLSRYDHLIARHAEKAGFDWRLIAALIFEESRFDPTRVSEKGAYGLMQITPIAAQEIGAKNYTAPPRNIEAGVKYLQALSRQFPYGRPQDRLALILASYVIGPGHVEDAQRLALALGYDPHCWAESMEEVLPLLEDPVYRNQTLYGFAKGRHAVRYVNAVRKRYALYTRYIPRTPDRPLIEAQAAGAGQAASAAG